MSGPINILISLVIAVALYVVSPQSYADNNRELSPTNEQLEQLKKAVSENDIAAIHMLGVLYTTGRGVEKDLKAGTELIQRAADRGFANSQLLISMMYNTGRGIYKIDRARSLAWAMMAKSQGLKEAEDYYQYVYRDASADEKLKAVEIYKNLSAN